MKNANASIWQYFLTLPISSHVTIGLAKIFNLEILTHGTSIQNAFRILKNGADPTKGGSSSGSTYYAVERQENEFIDRTRNYFYVFKDSEADLELGKMPAIVTRISIFFLPRLHAVLSGIAHTTNKKSLGIRIQRVALGIIHGTFSPGLRFIFKKEEIDKIFINDVDWGMAAYKTPEKLSNRRIGLIGVYHQASFAGLKQGVKNCPLRVVGGVIHLVAGVALTTVGLGFYI